MQEVQTGLVCLWDSLAKPICVAGPDQGDEHAGPEPCRVGGQTKFFKTIIIFRITAYLFEIISAACIKPFWPPNAHFSSIGSDDPP